MNLTHKFTVSIIQKVFGINGYEKKIFIFQNHLKLFRNIQNLIIQILEN